MGPREAHRRAQFEPVEALVRDREAGVLDRAVLVPRSSSLHSAAAVANALRFETEQLEEVGRIDEDLPRFAKARLAAEFGPHGCGLGKVAGGDVMPNLVPLGWRQYRPQGLVRSYETIEPRGPILAGPPRRLVEEERSRRYRWRRGLPSSG